MNIKKRNNNWGSKIEADNNRLYHLSQTFSNGQRAYYYVLINPLKEKTFLKELEGDEGSFELTDYGNVIASGWGTPPVTLKQQMKETYGLTSSDQTD